MITARGGFEFDDVLPRLVAAYESGRLVPFIGTGMSYPVCSAWWELIGALEKRAGIDAPQPMTKDTKPAELVERANFAIARLRYGPVGALAAAIDESLFTRAFEIPPPTAALAAMRWPLVLSTNYDNAFVAAHEREFGADSIAVAGRGAEDCQRVLNSLSTAGRSLLWALQGHIARPFPVHSQARDARLRSEIVIDHAEYRRVTYNAPHFRRAFAEVFRHRSLFFLGSGLRESYLHELFGEVLEIYGPNTRTHFAIIPEGEVDPRFMYDRFQIVVVEYPKTEHGESLRMIERLGAAIAEASAVPVAWGWGTLTHRARQVERCTPELEVIRGPLPLNPGEGECLAVSAGGARHSSAYFISKAMGPTLRGWKVPEPPQPSTVDSDGYVGRFAELPVFAVRARQAHKDYKDLSEIGPAASALFEVVAPSFSCIRMQLLAAGGGPDGSQNPGYDVRAFPERFAFIQIVRRWGMFRRLHPENRCRLVLHIVESALTRDIASGRIDVLEVLRCDDIRFWTEVVAEPNRMERQLFIRRPESTRLVQICQELSLTPQEWQLEVSPPPTAAEADFTHATITDKLDWTLDKLLVPPGGTLHFRRVNRRQERSMAEDDPQQGAATNTGQPIQVRSVPPVTIST